MLGALFNMLVIWLYDSLDCCSQFSDLYLFSQALGRGVKNPSGCTLMTFSEWPLARSSLYQSNQMSHRSPVSSLQSRVTRLEYRPNGLVIVIFAVWTNIFKTDNTLIHSAQFGQIHLAILTNLFRRENTLIHPALQKPHCEDQTHHYCTE